MSSSSSSSGNADSNAFEFSHLLEQYDDDFSPESAILAGPEILADGEYDLECVGAENRSVAGSMIIEMKLEVTNAGPQMGLKFKHALWLNKPESVNRVGAELTRLGFDVHLWKKDAGRPFSQEVQKVRRVLPGLRFRAKKRTSVSSGGKTFQNLDLLKRLPGDGRPPVLGPDQLNGPNEHDPFG